MPRSGQRASLCFAIADDAGDQKLRIVEHRAKGMA